MVIFISGPTKKLGTIATFNIHVGNDPIPKDNISDKMVKRYYQNYRHSKSDLFTINMIPFVRKHRIFGVNLIHGRIPNLEYLNKWLLIAEQSPLTLIWIYDDKLTYYGKNIIVSNIIPSDCNINMKCSDCLKCLNKIKA